jgi:hypothetical protein
LTFYPEVLTCFITEEIKSSPRNIGSCKRQSPALFFEGLDNPELEILNIKFLMEANSGMFLDVTSSALKNCWLGHLTELVLSTAGWSASFLVYVCLTHIKLPPQELRVGLKMFLPLPRLRKLRVSARPNFLDVLDKRIYLDIAKGLPSLE